MRQLPMSAAFITTFSLDAAIHSLTAADARLSQGRSAFLAGLEED